MMSPLPRPRESPVLVLDQLNRCIYLIGGYTMRYTRQHKAFVDVWRYNLITSEWECLVKHISSLHTDIPFERDNYFRFPNNSIDSSNICCHYDENNSFHLLFYDMHDRRMDQRFDFYLLNGNESLTRLKIVDEDGSLENRFDFIGPKTRFHGGGYAVNIRERFEDDNRPIDVFQIGINDTSMHWRCISDEAYGGDCIQLAMAIHSIRHNEPISFLFTNCNDELLIGFIGKGDDAYTQARERANTNYGAEVDIEYERELLRARESYIVTFNLYTRRFDSSLVLADPQFGYPLYHKKICPLVVKDRLYLIGGWRSNANREVGHYSMQRHLWSLDLRHFKWTLHMNLYLSTPVCNCSAVYVPMDNSIYIFGGQRLGSEDGHLDGGHPSECDRLLIQTIQLEVPKLTRLSEQQLMVSLRRHHSNDIIKNVSSTQELIRVVRSLYK